MWSTIILVMIGSACSFAGETVRLSESIKSVALSHQLSIYRDATGLMTLTEVQADWSRGATTLGDQRRPTFGFTPDAIWARWTVRNDDVGPAFWVIRLKTTRMDEVDFHVIRSSGDVRHFAAGNARVPSADQVDEVYPSFPLMLEAGEQVEVFARIQSETALQLPLEMIASTHLAGVQSREQLVHAGFFGYLLALIVLGFLFGMIAHERGFVLYSISLISCFACYFILSGYYAWFDFAGHDLVAKQGLIITSEFALFMMLIYLRYLLDLPRTLPAINRFVVWTLRVSAIIVLVLLVMPYRIAYPVILVHMSVVGLASVIVAFIAWYNGLKVARFYAVAWMFFWIFFGIGTFRHISAESVSRPFWANAFAGTEISVTFFFIAMADRVRELRRAATRSQEKLLQMEQQASKDLRQKLRQEQLLIRDLHDGIGGLTANLSILAEVGRRDATATQERDRFERISQMASDGSAEVRGLMSSLEARDMSWPDFFDECRRFGRVALTPHNMEFSLSDTGFTDQAGPGVFAGLSLLRVVKEAMTNAVKHAKCTRLTMLFDFVPNQLRITIRDNGPGFAAAINHGRGLRNMEARMREMGGTMTHKSEGGVEIVLELPLPVTLVDVEAGSGKRAES